MKVYFIKKEKVFGISIKKKSLNYFLKVYKRKKMYFKPEVVSLGKHWICGKGYVTYLVGK